MRIAVVHSFYTRRHPSGENNVVMDQVEALRECGHVVELVARHTDDHADDRLFQARAALTTVTGRGPSPAERLREFRPDVVHLHNTFPNWGTRWFSPWARRTVMTIHNYRAVCANALLFRDGHSCEECLAIPVLPAAVHRCYRSSALASMPVALGASPWGALRRIPSTANRLVCLNDQAASLFERVLGRSVDVVPNFVQRSTGSLQSSQGWVYVGRLSPEKGVEELLRGWPPGERLDLIGDGPQKSLVAHISKGRPEIRALGTMRRADIQARMASYEGLVVPSMCTEQMPTTVLEALAAGIPSLLSHHVAAADRLRSVGAAEVFAPEQRDLSARLAGVRTNRARMSAASRALYEAEYSPAVWLSRMEPIYEGIAGQPD